MKAKKSVSMKVLVLMMALVLVIGCGIGGTLAYLMTRTEDVTNTFVAGDVGSLELKETNGNEYMIIPGKDIEKDPTITFEGNNIDAYVFLKVAADGWKVETSGNTHTYSIGETGKEMTWTLSGWTKLEDGVYYKEVSANASTQTWQIIDGNKITVSSEITGDANNAVPTNYLKKLTFTAYAIQKDSVGTINAAWEKAQTASSPTP